MKTTLTLDLEVIDNTHGNYIVIRTQGWVIGEVKHLLSNDTFQATYSGGKRRVTNPKTFPNRAAAAQWILMKAAYDGKLYVGLTYVQGDHLKASA